MKRNVRILCAALAILIISAGSGILSAKADDGGPIITFAQNQATSNHADVVIDGTTATITAPGSYSVTGSCDEGKLVINTSGKVTLLLDNLTLTSTDGPAIDVQDAKEVILSLPDGTQNTISDTNHYASATGGQDAAIFSKADLIISGVGALTVSGRYNDGIASRDTLLIEGGNVTINAAGHGIKGKDYLLIAGGTIEVVAGGDGAKATNADQTGLGYVQIDGGTLDITAQDDGISAVSQVTINGGDIRIDTANNGIKSEGGLTIAGGRVAITTADDAFVSQTRSISEDADVTITER